MLRLLAVTSEAAATRETVLQCDYCGFIASRRTDGGSAAAPTPADFERVAAEGVMSMFLS